MCAKVIISIEYTKIKPKKLNLYNFYAQYLVNCKFICNFAATTTIEYEDRHPDCKRV